MTIVRPEHPQTRRQALNLSTALLINVLIIAAAAVLTTSVRLTVARISQGFVGSMIQALIVVFSFSLPHAALV